MAKTKEKVDNSVSSDSFIKELEKEFGNGVIKTANNIINLKRDIVHTTPQLDIPLGGGIPSGSVVIISGAPKIGKTTMILCICADAQKLDKEVWYFDVEHRLKKMNLEGIEGLDISEDKFHIISSEQGCILTAEKTLSMVERVIHTRPNSIVVIDSSSALCAEAEMTADITGQARSQGPKLLANFCRKNGNAIAVNNITLLVIQHLINDTSGMGRGKLEDGGEKIQYQQDVKIRALYKENWKVGTGENEKIIGQKVHWKMLTGALPGNCPNSEVTTYLRYGVGFDKLQEYLIIGTDLNLIQKGGAWYSYGELKFQGEAKLYEFFKDDKEAQTKLISEIKNILG